MRVQPTSPPPTTASDVSYTPTPYAPMPGGHPAGQTAAHTTTHPCDRRCQAGVNAGRTRQTKEDPMNWDRIEGNWKQLKGKVKEQWGKLSDDDFDVIAGRREQLAGKIQERYGLARDEAERQVSDWERRADDRWLS